MKKTVSVLFVVAVAMIMASYLSMRPYYRNLRRMEGEGGEVQVKSRSTKPASFETTDTAAFRNDTSTNDQPYFVMFVGPGKTATTSVQLALEKMEEKKIMAADNYIYLGRSIKKRPWWSPLGAAMIPLQYRKSWGCRSTNVTECWWKHAMPAAQDILALPNKPNIIMYEEYLHDGAGLDLQALFSTFEKHYRFLIVVGYRRKWSWDWSLRNQYEKRDPNLDPRGNKWPPAWDPSSDQRAPRGRPISARAYLQSRITDSTVHCQTLASAYAPIFGASQLRLLNLHQRSNVLVHFLCDILPNAPHLCSDAKTTTYSDSSNPSKDLSLDHIAVEAAEHHLISKETWPSRGTAVKALAQCAQRLSLTIPQECLDQQSQELYLNRSLEIERKVMGDFVAASPYLQGFLTPEEEKRHVESFWDASTQFCSPNMTFIMEDAGWLECFDTMNSTVQTSW